MNITAAWSGKSSPETSCCRPALPTGIKHEQVHNHHLESQGQVIVACCGLQLLLRVVTHQT